MSGEERLCDNCNSLEHGHPSLQATSPRRHMPTNACGDIELGNRSQRRPKYIRVGDFTDTSKVLHMMKTDWKLQEVPNLIVSIIGGANSFQIKTNLHAELEQGLRKIATKTR